MLDKIPPTPRNAPRPLPVMELAKWPPDDDDAGALPPAGGGGGIPAGGGYSGGGDGDFKKGRFAPIAVLVGIVAVAGLAGFLLLGAKKDAEKLTVEQAQDLK